MAMEGHLNRRQLLEKTLGVFGAVASTAITAEQPLEQQRLYMNC